jgi:hypothetical protein
MLLRTPDNKSEFTVPVVLEPTPEQAAQLFALLEGNNGEDDLSPVYIAGNGLAWFPARSMVGMPVVGGMALVKAKFPPVAPSAEEGAFLCLEGDTWLLRCRCGVRLVQQMEKPEPVANRWTAGRGRIDSTVQVARKEEGKVNK